MPGSVRRLIGAEMRVHSQAHNFNLRGWDLEFTFKVLLCRF